MRGRGVRDQVPAREVVCLGGVRFWSLFCTLVHSKDVRNDSTACTIPSALQNRLLAHRQELTLTNKIKVRVRVWFSRSLI
jgi:hypothetical protein